MTGRANWIIVGCGHVGTRLLASAGGQVAAAWAAHARHTNGVEVRACDLDHGPLPEVLPGSIVIYLVPPPRSGQADTRLARFLNHAANRPVRLVYAGTTGVYGDCGGAWVDETAPLRPADARSARRVDAERQLARWARQHGRAAVVLRLAGIYGPGRLPLARLRAGRPVVRQPDATWSNRVHVDDVVQAILAAAGTAVPPGEVLPVNVADDAPSTMTDYLHACADALGLPRLPEVDLATALADASPALRGYLTQSRRVANGRLKTTLGVRLLHPDLRSGLAASLAE